MEQKFPQITHVIFDLDGTLVDSERVYEQVYSSICNKYGMDYTPEIRVQHVGTPDTDSAEIICRLGNLPISPEEYGNQAKVELDRVLGQCPTMPGVDRLVLHLSRAGVPLAIATSSTEEAMTLKLSSHPEVKGAFGHIVCAGSDPEVRRGKPAPDVFLVCLGRFPNPPPPQQALVFEDSVNGVKAALAAGMTVVAVPDPTVARELLEGSALILPSLESFQPELFGLPPFDSQQLSDPARRPPKPSGCTCVLRK